jgi:DeoR/GlpR family transcriptional regulator of sugar metabolism
MLKKERQRQIIKWIEAQGEATVSELAEKLGVSQMTIRRDLRELAAQGAAERVHGGAVMRVQERLFHRKPVMEGAEEEADVKRRIGEAAAAMVEEGETIFIGAGTTTLAVAEALKDRRDITVMTNALTVANSLANSQGITVLVTGGILRSGNLSLIGFPAERNLQDVRADKVISGIRGIDPDIGLTSDDLHEMKTNLAIMAISKTLIVVADHTKFGCVAASRTAPVTAASTIVTDVQAPEHMVAELRKQGVKIVQV